MSHQANRTRLLIRPRLAACLPLPGSSERAMASI